MKNELKKLNWKNFVMLTVAGIVNAFGITMFLMPVKLYDSGISGTSMLLSYLTPLPLSVFLLILNLPLFLYGLKRQGLAFTIYASYAVACYSFFSWIITGVLPIDMTNGSPLAGNDLVLCALFGGLISGVGSGLAVRFGGAMDGIEVLAVIFSKRLGMTVGTFVMVYNVLLYVVCGCIYKSWELPLYSIITYYAALTALDFIVEGISRSKAAMIVTQNPEGVGKALSDGFGCGVTEIPAKGGYSRTERTVLYFVVNRFQIGKMRTIVHDVDPLAYITINDVADVFSANHDSGDSSGKPAAADTSEAADLPENAEQQAEQSQPTE